MENEIATQEKLILEDEILKREYKERIAEFTKRNQNIEKLIERFRENKMKNDEWERLKNDEIFLYVFLKRLIRFETQVYFLYKLGDKIISYRPEEVETTTIEDTEEVANPLERAASAITDIMNHIKKTTN